MCSPSCFRASALRAKSGIEVVMRARMMGFAWWADEILQVLKWNYNLTLFGYTFPDLDYNLTFSASLE